MDVRTALVLSICLSLRSVIFLLVKTIVTEKIFVPFKSKCCLLLWSIFSCCRRILSIISFFIPSLGLFNILYHLKAEQIPFFSRRHRAFDGRLKPSDKIELFNFTREILWSDIDRGSYEDNGDYLPVPYTHYTGLTLQQTFVAFLSLNAIHFIIVFVIKQINSPDFKTEKIFNKVRERKIFWITCMQYFIILKVLHCFECLNVLVPFQDWDTQQSDSIKSLPTWQWFNMKSKQVSKEMKYSYLLSLIMTLVMMVPLWYTGNKCYFS